MSKLLLKKIFGCLVFLSIITFSFSSYSDDRLLAPLESKEISGKGRALEFFIENDILYKNNFKEVERARNIILKNLIDQKQDGVFTSNGNFFSMYLNITEIMTPNLMFSNDLPIYNNWFSVPPEANYDQTLSVIKEYYLNNLAVCFPSCLKLDYIMATCYVASENSDNLEDTRKKLLSDYRFNIALPNIDQCEYKGFSDD